MKKYIKEIFNGYSKQLSSKRVFGGILLIWACILASVLQDTEIINSMLIVGGSLIGVETIARAIKK